MNDTVVKSRFNFNEWSKLAVDDPEAFENERIRAIEQMLQSLPETKQQRLRGLQWRIDQERRRSKSPMAACIQLSRMMWDTVVGDDGLLDTIQNLDPERMKARRLEKQGLDAKILPFTRSTH
jgi:hypothetical protein